MFSTPCGTNDLTCLLPPANGNKQVKSFEVCEGYVFTGVCLSTGELRGGRGDVHGRGVCVVRGMHGTHAAPSPPADTMRYGQ